MSGYLINWFRKFRYYIGNYRWFLVKNFDGAGEHMVRAKSRHHAISRCGSPDHWYIDTEVPSNHKVTWPDLFMGQIVIIVVG